MRNHLEAVKPRIVHRAADCPSANLRHDVLGLGHSPSTPPVSVPENEAGGPSGRPTHVREGRTPCLGPAVSYSIPPHCRARTASVTSDTAPISSSMSWPPP